MRVRVEPGICVEVTAVGSERYKYSNNIATIYIYNVLQYGLFVCATCIYLYRLVCIPMLFKSKNRKKKQNGKF